MKSVLQTGVGDIDQLRFTDVAAPVPKKTEANIRVLYCGVNHLDLHIRAGRRPGIPSFPHILGSEIVGKIVELSETTADYHVGDIVAVYPWTFCGMCFLCTHDHEQICDRGGTIGRTQWGGYATHAVVPIQNLLKLPFGLHPESACAVTLTGPTAYHLIQRSGIPEKETVLLTGASGGVGTIALQLLLQKKCRVICATSHPQKARQLRVFGAWKTVDVSNLSEEVAEIIPAGVPYAIDLIGGSVWTGALQSLAKHGTIVFCATSQNDPAQIPLGFSFSRELTILGSYGGSRNDLKNILLMAAKGQVKPVITVIYDLKNAAKAHEDLEQQKIVGKILLRA